MALSRMRRQYERSEQRATCAELIEYNHAAVTTATVAIATDAAGRVVMVSVRHRILCSSRSHQLSSHRRDIVDTDSAIFP